MCPEHDRTAIKRRYGQRSTFPTPQYHRTVTVSTIIVQHGDRHLCFLIKTEIGVMGRTLSAETQTSKALVPISEYSVADVYKNVNYNTGDGSLC